MNFISVIVAFYGEHLLLPKNTFEVIIVISYDNYDKSREEDETLNVWADRTLVAYENIYKPASQPANKHQPREYKTNFSLNTNNNATRKQRVWRMDEWLVGLTKC